MAKRGEGEDGVYMAQGGGKADEAFDVFVSAPKGADAKDKRPATLDAGLEPPVVVAPEASSEKNWQGVTSLVFAILGWLLFPLIFALIFGLLGLRSAKEGKASNPGVARAGVIISFAWIGILVVGAIVTQGLDGLTGTDRRDATDTYAVGECLLEPNARDRPDGTQEYAEARVIDCSRPHWAEVLSVEDLSGDVYPGEAFVLDAVEAMCTAADEAAPYDIDALVAVSQDLYLSYLYPSRDTWRLGARQLVCLVSVDEGEVITGSLLLTTP